MLIGNVRATEYGFDFFLTFVIGLKEMHNICCLVYNKEDPDQVKRMNELIRVCIDEAAALGYGEYRTHIGELNIRLAARIRLKGYRTMQRLWIRSPGHTIGTTRPLES